jgi:hypothetical protein
MYTQSYLLQSFTFGQNRYLSQFVNEQSKRNVILSSGTQQVLCMCVNDCTIYNEEKSGFVSQTFFILSKRFSFEKRND